MAILGHHGRRISLRVLFHAPAGPSLGTGTRRCLSAIAFPVIGIRLFRPASPPRPLSGLPAVRAGVRGVSSSRLLESHARPGPSAEAQLKVENGRLQALLRLREQQLFGRKTENSAATAPAAWMRPTPTHRHDGRVASNAVGPVRHAATTPTYLPFPRKGPAARPVHCSHCGQPFAVSRHRGSQSWRSMSGPIAVVRRRRYRPTCRVVCPGIVTAPPPPALIPKSIWESRSG